MSFLRSAHDLSKIIRLKLAQYTNVYYLCRVKLKHIITMSNETDYLISLLMQNKAKMYCRAWHHGKPCSASAH